MTQLNDPNLDSVRRYVNLPRTRHLNPNSQKLFSLDKQLDPNQKFASPQLKTTRNKLLDLIQNQAQIFQNPDYNFVFPPTIFPDYMEGEIKNRVLVNRNDDYEQEDTFGHKLNQQQIENIREKGQFKMASKINNGKVPHVWKINDWIVRGRVNIVEVWQNGLATCCQLVVSAAILFSTQIPDNIINILGLPIKLFDLIFGKRAITKFYTPDFRKEIAIDFWSDVMQNQLRNVNKEIGNNFLQLLYIKYEDHLNNDILVSNRLDSHRKKQEQVSNFKTRLMNMEANFNREWQLQKKEVVDKMTVKNIGNEQKVLSQDEQQRIVQKVEEQKINRYLIYIRKNLPKQNMSQNAIEALVHLILIVTFIDGKLKQKTKRLTKMQNQIRLNIREQYPIRSRIGFCEGRLFKKQYESAKQRYEDQFYEQLGNNNYFRTLLNETYFCIYQKYLRMRKFYNTFLQQKKSKLKCLYGPVRVFRSTYPLLPSYQVVVSKGFDNESLFTLKKYVEMHSDTSTHFWKFKLYCMRLKSWTINWIVSLIGLAWAGPFGLRCLCGVDDFAYDQDINPTTGIKSEIKRETVLEKFRNVLQSIERSRSDFEAQPDLGLLGKSISRICNYIECYFFRLMLIGVLGVLVIYPIAIIISSLVCFFLVLTFWFWIPVALLICYLFNILIFEFQISYQFQGCLIKSIPLLSIILQFVMCIVRIIFAFLLLFVFAPLFAILYFIFLVLTTHSFHILNGNQYIQHLQIYVFDQENNCFNKNKQEYLILLHK